MNSFYFSSVLPTRFNADNIFQPQITYKKPKHVLLKFFQKKLRLSVKEKEQEEELFLKKQEDLDNFMENFKVKLRYLCYHPQ